ncbi:hypothetical protein MRX96_043924 [Rhipicephalus microplus]
MDGAFIDNEILIAAVQHRLPLWMASHRQHKDKIVKAAMWREVAAAVLPNVNIGDVRRSLYRSAGSRFATSFRRLFVANKKAKSGAGLDDVECITITWPYFQLLYFLKDTMQTRARAVLQLSCEEQATDGAFIDNEILIAAVQHRLPLWIASHRQHKDEIVKAAMWREVAAAVLPNVNIDDAAELVQKRWKSLRDKFWRLFELLQDMVQFEDQCLELSEASAHSDDGASGPPGVVCPYTRSVIEAFLLTRQENRANPPTARLPLLAYLLPLFYEQHEEHECRSENC